MDAAVEYFSFLLYPMHNCIVSNSSHTRAHDPNTVENINDTVKRGALAWIFSLPVPEFCMRHAKEEIQVNARRGKNHLASGDHELNYKLKNKKLKRSLT